MFYEADCLAFPCKLLVGYMRVQQFYKQITQLIIDRSGRETDADNSCHLKVRTSQLESTRIG